MKIAFSLCSINYLAQAKTLCESMKETNPDWRFIYGIVDKNTQHVDLSFLDGEVLYVENVPIDGFEEMVNIYTIVELVTAVKPYYFSYLFQGNPDAEKIVYFDPDIVIFGSLNDLENKLDAYDIILTPHFTVPIPQGDSCLPTEIHVFNTGVYNLGFLAVKRSTNTINMLKWWEDKLRYDCIIDLTRGYFVDQLWMSLVPAYFDKVLIDKYAGYNMAHWNLHERKLTATDSGYLANEVPLVFYHFSHYSPAKPQEIAAFHNRYDFTSRPDIVSIYKLYHNSLLNWKYFDLKKVSCYYMRNEKSKKRKRAFENFLRQALPMQAKATLKKVLAK
ncbi:MAG: glycosyl transferase [Hymenobacter sp.]|nr:MAG: glycosyl transferase [Hymenobacter sp.]